MQFTAAIHSATLPWHHRHQIAVTGCPADIDDERKNGGPQKKDDNDSFTVVNSLGSSYLERYKDMINEDDDSSLSSTSSFDSSSSSEEEEVQVGVDSSSSGSSSSDSRMTDPLPLKRMATIMIATSKQLLQRLKMPHQQQ